MIRYLIRRILYAIPVLVGVMLLTYVLFYVVVSPEGQAKRNLSAKNPSQAQIHQWLVDHGYNKSKSEQFVGFMGDLLKFDLGKSDRTKEPIIDRVKAGAVPSLEV